MRGDPDRARLPPLPGGASSRPFRRPLEPGRREAAGERATEGQDGPRERASRGDPGSPTRESRATGDSGQVTISVRFDAPTDRGVRWLKATIGVLIALALVITWLSVRTVWGAFSMAYDVTPAAVTIRFGPSRITIPRHEILQVWVEAEPTDLRRRFGSSFPGLYQGRWTSETTGTIYLYATARKPLVVLETPDRRYGLSPKEPEAFVAAVQTGAPGSFSPFQSNAPLGLAALAFFPIFMLCVAILFFLMYLRIARRVAYELTDDALLILGPSRPISVPYSEIEDVRIENPPGFPHQIGGIALPGFYWGSCSWRAVGRHIRMHATQLRPIILFRRRRSVYGISPREPEAFLTELKRRLPKRA